MNIKTRLAFAAALFCAVPAAHATVFINKVFINPPGSGDSLYEFIELAGTPGKKLDGYAIAVVNGTLAKYYPLNSIPPRPAVAPEIDEFFSLDGLELGPNGLLVIMSGDRNFDLNTLLPDTAVHDDWVGAIDSANRLWNGLLDVPSSLQNDGSNSFLLIRNRPGSTQANPNPATLRWGKDIYPDDEVFHNIVDPQSGTPSDQYGDGNFDFGQSNGGLPTISSPPGYPPQSAGQTFDMTGQSTPTLSDDLEIVDEVSMEHDRGWEFDTDERHVDVNSPVVGLPYRHVHALDDVQGFNSDMLIRVDSRVTGTGWVPTAGATGEYAGGTRNWQDTATEQWIRGDSVQCDACPGQGAAPRFFMDNTANTNPNVIPGQPYRTQVPLWLNDGVAPDYSFAVNSYQIMAGRVTPLSIPWIPGDIDRDGDCDAADIAKLATRFGNDNWVFPNAVIAPPGQDPQLQDRPWDFDQTGSNGIEPSDLQWTLNFQANTNGQIVGRTYDSTTPSTNGVYLNPAAPVACQVSTTASSPCGRSLSALFVGDVVEVVVSARVTSGANLTAGEQNGVMQAVHDIAISAGNVLRVVTIEPIGSFAKTRGSLESAQGVSGDLGTQRVNVHTTSFTVGLTQPDALYRVRLQAIGAGSAQVAVAPSAYAKFVATTPGGLKVGHTNSDGNPAAVAYSGALTVVTVTASRLGDVNGDTLVNNADVQPFVQVLAGFDTDPNRVARSDLNCDGKADGRDIQPFVNMLLMP